MEGNSITGHKDTDRILLMYMDTETFLNTYKIKNKYIHSLFDENMFKYRVEKEFPRIDHLVWTSWKKYYFTLIYWSNLLKEKYGFVSDEFKEHPITYYNLLLKYFRGRSKEGSDKNRRRIGTEGNEIDLMNHLLYDAAENGYLDIVKYAIKNGADNYQGGMNQAAYGGDIETFEYFRQNYPYDLYEALDWANVGDRIKDNTVMINHIKNLISKQ